MMSAISFTDMALRTRRRALARPAGLFLAALHAPLPRLSTAFPRRFAPQARELWLVGGERSLLGHTVSLEEYAGCSATGPPNPIVSHSPTDDHKKYGLSYIDMDTRAKFHCDSLCSVGVRMRGPLSAKARPRSSLPTVTPGEPIPAEAGFLRGHGLSLSASPQGA